MAAKDGAKALKLAYATLTGGEASAALTANPAAAPAGGSGAAAGGWDTAANRDAAIVTINGLRTRVSEIEAVLQTFGLLK